MRRPAALYEPGENHPVRHVEHGEQQREEHAGKPVDLQCSGAIPLRFGRRRGGRGRDRLRGRPRCRRDRMPVDRFNVVLQSVTTSL